MKNRIPCCICILLSSFLAQFTQAIPTQPRTVITLDTDWTFYRYADTQTPDTLVYDHRPGIEDARDDKPADAQPTERAAIGTSKGLLKPWILPTGNAFIKNPSLHHRRPAGDPGADFPFVQASFDDKDWQRVSLPHDWAVDAPFYSGWNVPVGGGMGRLPVHGVAWYRRKLDIPVSDAGKTIYLEVEGAMSYAMVWLNGHLVGGWPYGYNSWQLDLTPYVVPGGVNQLAIRLDNPANSSRWYPGSGLYRPVHLIKTSAVHVAQWGTVIQTSAVSEQSATLDYSVTVRNATTKAAVVDVQTAVYELDAKGDRGSNPVAAFSPVQQSLKPGTLETVKRTLTLATPKRWGPPPTQIPHRYVALTNLYQNGALVDRYETVFGIRDIRFDAEKGLFVNGERIVIKGVNQHHDLGALGAAYNQRAAQRQLEMLQELGCNAIRMAHNPPSPGLLALTDAMGFLVIDEVFDSWERKKTPHDFHLIFPDWYEQDIRSMIRRDKNHPSIIAWSFGNEVGEQYTDTAGANLAFRLRSIVKDEDPTRPTTLAMNYAKPNMPLPVVPDLIGLNYQGEGIRYDGLYTGLKGITTAPQFPAFHEKYPNKLIYSSENASTLSSRGVYYFPVTPANSSPIKDGQGGDSKAGHVSAYELYSVDFGSSPDKVFASLDSHPFVAGGFVWTGWDHLGEPTPYYTSRSSYCGIIDMAGFKKDRYYLYQAYWRPDYPMAHILPHWNWPDRVGQVTPVHVFTSGDEAELFLNGVSLGRKKKAPLTYRLRWDEVVYAPGTLTVVAYKNGKRWATDRVETTGEAYSVHLSADRPIIMADGHDLTFVTATIIDQQGRRVPVANNQLSFSVEGPGRVVATDNGDPTNMSSLSVSERPAFNGLCLAIVKAQKGASGTVRIKATANGLKTGVLAVKLVTSSKELP